MTEQEAFEQTQKGLIKRGSRYGSKTYMYPDRAGFVVQKDGRTREARREELVGYGNWIPAEDYFEEESDAQES